MKQIRSMLGILLIIIAVGGFLFWEIKGREMLYLEQVVVTNRVYMPGQVITAEGLSVAGFPEEVVISDAVLPEEVGALLGKEVKQYIPAMAQMSLSFTGENLGLKLKENESIYTINPDWVNMKSTSLRRGDTIRIITDDGKKVLGTYKVAFVKDQNDREITNGGELLRDLPLDRQDSTGIIHKVEVISTLEDFMKIKNTAEGNKENLLMIQKMP